ncbi:MAG: hypothetical protein ACOYM2_00005 [Rectinemataceae bacterium]|jgi:hypothetical protein
MEGSSLVDRLRGTGVIECFRNFGHDPDSLLATPEKAKANLYAEYTWLVRPHSYPGLKDAIVIHALPPISAAMHLPWEEWFVLDGEKRHHVHFLERSPKCEGEISLAKDDTDHPPEAVGKTWYYFVDRDLRPLLFQD